MIYKLDSARSAAADDRTFEWLAKIVDSAKFNHGVEVRNAVRGH
jgi:hypothetical protein